jgi:NAD(P)-dependent dehydrogenase (short-subunit alcohol dehydrogenase family)
VVDKTGRVDISFNAIGIPPNEILGTSLVDISLQKFMRAAHDYLASYFLTARAAARHMISRKSGVIMVVTALPARFGSRMNGGYGAGQAAKDALTRDLSAELAPHGIRVVGLRPHGIPASRTMRELYDAKGEAMGISFDQFSQSLAAMTHPKRVMELEDIGGVAAFLASDKASGMTGTNVNLTMGSLDD